MCPYFVFCDVISLSGKKSDLKIENLEILVPNSLWVIGVFLQVLIFSLGDGGGAGGAGGGG